MSDLILALDFGGTKLTAALTSSNGLAAGRRQWLARKQVFSPAQAEAQYEIDTMVEMSRHLLQGAAAAAVGVSFGGPVDFASGTVRLSHHVPAWENKPLRTMLAREFAAPAQVDNDANAAALAEHRFGAGQGYNSLMYITVSTGVGGGWVLDGRPWRGYEGMAGEIGHTVVDPDGPLCLCGKRGCVERLASGPYMAEDLRESWGDGHGDISGQRVAEAAAAGDAVAQKILLRGAWGLGVGIGNAANLINLQLFVLGGGVTKSGAAWWTAVKRAAHQTALPEVHFEIVPAMLGDDTPLWGAAILAQDCLSRKDEGT
jgi:glucokinase